jgi:hypothetical protein
MAVKHIIKEDSRTHVVWYSTNGKHCSCKECEINEQTEKLNKGLIINP